MTGSTHRAIIMGVADLLEFVALLGVVALALFGVISLWKGRQEPAAPPEPGRRWTWSDHHPEPAAPDRDPPDRVEHVLDLEALVYRTEVTTYHPEISAESDTSVLREEFEVRRLDEGGWQIRLIGRNGYRIDGGEWQPGPSAFFDQWDAAWRSWRSPQARR